MKWIIGAALLGGMLLVGIVAGIAVTNARVPLDSASAIAAMQPTSPATDVAITTVTATEVATRTATVVATRTAVATRTETATATATATTTETAAAPPSTVVETVRATRPNRHGGDDG